MPLPGMPPAPDGAMPSPPPGGAGPAAMPGAMPGSSQQGMAALKVGIEVLQKALPHLPMGSKLHQTVLKAVADIGKNMEKEGGDSASVAQQLIEAMRQAKQGPNMAAMMPGGGAPQSPPPPMPPMGM